MARLHEAAWVTAGVTRVRGAICKTYAVRGSAVRLVLAIAAIEERAGRAARFNEARLLAAIDAKTMGIQLGKLGAGGSQWIEVEGRTGLRLTSKGRDVANDFARRMQRHLDAVEALIEDRDGMK